MTMYDECLNGNGSDIGVRRLDVEHTAHSTLGRGPMPIFYRLSARIGIIQVKVDGLERSKQHRNMHKLSTFNRSRRVTDTVTQTRSQISEFRHARADPFRANRHAAQCTLPPSWATPPPRGTATCEMGLHRQPEHGSSDTIVRVRSHTHAQHCNICKRAPAAQ